MVAYSWVHKYLDIEKVIVISAGYHSILELKLLNEYEYYVSLDKTNNHKVKVLF